MQSVKKGQAALLLHLLDREHRTNAAQENVRFQDDHRSPEKSHRNDQLEFQPQNRQVDFQAFPLFETAKMDVLYGEPPFSPYCPRCGNFSIQKEGSRVGESTRSGMVEKPAESPDEELSFSVFVNEEEEQGEQEPKRAEEEAATKEAEILQKCTWLNRKHNKSKMAKQQQHQSILSRSEGTESGRFLLKVFYPVSLVPKVPKSNSVRMASRSSSSRNLNAKESHGRAKSGIDGFSSKNFRRSKSSDSINSPIMSCMHLGSRKSWSDGNISGIDIRRKTAKADDRTNSSSKSR